jgi:transposase
MRTRPFRLSDEQAHALQAAFLHCQDADTKTRYQAVRLYGSGYAVEQIIDICACTPRSLLRWCKAYKEGGLVALLDHRQGGTRAKLGPEQLEVVQNQLHRYTPAQLLGRQACAGDGQFWTVGDLATLLQRDYGVVYQSPTSYRELLTKCDFSYQRPSKQYKSHSDTKVMECAEQLEKNCRHCPKRAGNGDLGRG